MLLCKDGREIENAVMPGRRRRQIRGQGLLLGRNEETINRRRRSRCRCRILVNNPNASLLVLHCTCWR